MAYTLLQLRQALAEEAFSGEFPIRLLTTAAGSATALTFGDLAFGASGATANQYHGCWLYNTAAVPTAPFSSRVLQQAGLTPTTGVLTVAPAFGSSPGNATEIIFCYDLHPDELHRAINRILRNLIYYAYLPVTMVPDGNMEDSGVTSWPQVGTTTITKSAGTFTGDYILFGRQMLSVAAADSGEGARSLSIQVNPGESLLVSVPIQADGDTVAVKLYDATNSADIKSVNVSNQGPVEVRFTANAPSTCHLVQVRFISGTASGNFIVGPVSLLSQRRRRYPLSFAQSVSAAVSGFNTIANIRNVYRVPAGSSISSDVYYSFDQPWQDIDVGYEEDLRAEGSAQNIVLSTYPNDPIFIEVQARFPELGVTAALINATTNTTLADRDTIVQGAMHYIERARYAKVAASNSQLAAIHLGRSREYAQKFARMRQAQGYGIVAREIPQARTTVAMS